MWPFQPNLTYQYFYRTQHLVEGSAFCSTGAVLTGFSYRVMAVRPSIPVQTYRQLTLTIGHTAMTPQTMSMTWAANRSGLQTVVINGTYVLPPMPWTGVIGPWGIVNFPLAAPFVYQRSMGNLLLDFDIADVPTSSSYTIPLDADTPGGASSRTLGVGGRLSNSFQVEAQIYNVTRMHPGGQIEIGALPWGIAGLALFGSSITQWGSLRLPLDLTPFGAPGNSLYVSPDLMLLLLPRYGGYTSAILPIPNQQSVVGVVLFIQTMHPDAAANALGWVFSAGREIRIGDVTSPMLQIFGLRTSATASYVSNGAPTVRLQGTFN
jgi:hypothetical protein